MQGPCKNIRRLIYNKIQGYMESGIEPSSLYKIATINVVTK